ncbi:MAG: flavin reductase family protein [Cyanobacteria bacterium SIG29]|nr:flavin reductase family protein [Cyanobacteria bacterium SIG29]
MNKNVFNNLSYGVYIVSCKNGDKFTGCTVNSIMQVTSSPATIALSLNKDNYTRLCIEEHEMFAVSILSVQSNPLSIGTFGFRTGKDFDKFSVIEHSFYHDMPVIKDACGYLICKIKDKIETSSHILFLADVLEGDLLNSEIPMTYSYYHNVIKGKSPKNAPTYIE